MDTCVLGNWRNYIATKLAHVCGDFRAMSRLLTYLHQDMSNIQRLQGNPEHFPKS